jgi:hypothetical protein
VQVAKLGRNITGSKTVLAVGSREVHHDPTSGNQRFGSSYAATQRAEASSI